MQVVLYIYIYTASEFVCGGGWGGGGGGDNVNEMCKGVMYTVHI